MDRVASLKAKASRGVVKALAHRLESPAQQIL
jgi:hypothetical protein